MNKEYETFYNYILDKIKECYKETLLLKKEFDELLLYDRKINKYDVERYLELKNEIQEINLQFNIYAETLINFVELYSNNKEVRYEYGVELSDFGIINKYKRIIKENLI